MHKLFLILALSNVFMLIAGLWLGYDAHPYEKCKEKYVTAEDMEECIWLLENQPTLR